MNIRQHLSLDLGRKRAKRKFLRCYALDYRRWRPESLLLTFFFLIQRDFWRGAVNITFLLLISGYTAQQWLMNGASQWFCLLLQLLFMPVWMALEEFLHAIVALHKAVPQSRLELVSIYRPSAFGRYWFYEGAAMRIHGPLMPVDRMHISAPGPFLNALLAILLWIACGLSDGHFLWGRVHQVFLPTMAHFLSTFLPVRAKPSDIRNILAARCEAGYDWLRTSRICWHGIVFLFGQRPQHELGMKFDLRQKEGHFSA